MRAGSAANSDQHLTQASITVKSIASELQRQQDGIVAQNIAATAFQADEIKKLDELRSGHSKRREENRAYRQKMQEAVAANELAMRLEAKARREKVRHTREMARMKWSCFPFANGGRWQKGTVIGPGPLPIRKLALLKRPSPCDEEQDQEEIHLSSHHRHRHQSGPSSSQRDRVAAAFELLRRLAKTYDPHYLDFDRAFLRLDRANRGFLRPADFRVMMRPLGLSDDDHMLLWSHFDRNQSGFVAKDDLVWGFYNKRQVLQEAQRVDDSTLFRAEVLDHIIHEQKIDGGASVEGDRATEGSKKKDSSENNKTTVMVRLGGVRELQDLPDGYKVFCIASCCQICKDDNEDTLIISSEVRSEVAIAKSMGNNLHSMQVNWDDDFASIELSGVSTKHIEMEHLLLEFRATAPGATSDVQVRVAGLVATTQKACRTVDTNGAYFDWHDEQERCEATSQRQGLDMQFKNYEIHPA
ncbi:Hypothetical Protein FCC1311_031562 [Hondaea fermentalgiana]|uniref:EF-hand domain-containing protein n=1 Tax=Hondaea fermentalgiana TaxID=2315210 RepID=A0A2R5GE77_9STRA|nr:Hypothetical Protein FCC1311_031562 [Hondaea fermentalgiana]|eukprot:GBG26933.1 Hypothetical Protein FCC1311_031562 [Hondaea fermentalgiana]